MLVCSNFLSISCSISHDLPVPGTPFKRIFVLSLLITLQLSISLRKKESQLMSPVNMFFINLNV